MDWPSFFAGLSTGIVSEAAVGALLTAPLAVWYFKRQIPQMLDKILADDDKKLVELRQKIFNAMMGNFGGRPVSIKKMVKATGGMIIQQAAPALAQRAVGWLQRNRLMGNVPQGAGYVNPMNMEIVQDEEGHKYARLPDTA